MARGFALAACAFALWACSAVAQQDTGPFTPAQAHKATANTPPLAPTCHHENLSGGGEAPSLAGGNFLKSWGERSTRELYDYLQSAMPLGKGGSLSDQTYQNIVAFLLEANGATAGGKPFTADTEVKIGNVANGQMPPGIVPRGEATPPLRSGLTVAGAGTRLHASHRRDAASSSGWRLAHVPAQLSGLELQPAQADQRGQRQKSSAEMGLGDERRRRQ